MGTRVSVAARRCSVGLLVLFMLAVSACGFGGARGATTDTPRATSTEAVAPAGAHANAGQADAGVGSPGNSGAATDANSSQSQAADMRAGRGISVSAEGHVDAAPDVAFVNFGFVAENANLSPAQAQVARESTAVITKMKSLGVKPEDIRTANYNVGRNAKKRVFVVSMGLRIIIRDVPATGKLVDAAVAAGANRVAGINFAIEDRAAVERQAREKAMQNANAKAAELARHGGVALGAAITINEGYYDPYADSYEYAEVTSSVQAGSAPVTPVQPGQLRVSISVQVTYAIR